MPVPEPLRPWVGWVLRADAEEARCPRLDGHADAHVCAWPARLTLALGEHGGWRDRHRLSARPLLYDMSQLLFAGLAVASVMILFGAIEQGLVSQPDMRVLGNGSEAALLRWARWIWTAARADGWWQPIRAKVQPAPPPAPSSAPRSRACEPGARRRDVIARLNPGMLPGR